MTALSLYFRLDGEMVTFDVAPETTLGQLLGLPIGCGEGVCGACTVAVDGVPVRSCLMLAVQAEGCDVATLRSLARIEGAAVDDGGLTPLQRALSDHHAFQCGWCVPGLLVGTACRIAGRTQLSDREINEHLLGHLCRCAASAGVADAIRDVFSARREGAR